MYKTNTFNTQRIPHDPQYLHKLLMQWLSLPFLVFQLFFVWDCTWCDNILRVCVCVSQGWIRTCLLTVFEQSRTGAETLHLKTKLKYFRFILRRYMAAFSHNQACINIFIYGKTENCEKTACWSVLFLVISKGISKCF